MEQKSFPLVVAKSQSVWYNAIGRSQSAGEEVKTMDECMTVQQLHEHLERLRWQEPRIRDRV